MSNFALTSLALSSVCPTNKVIVDDKGDPSVMVERPAQMLNALLTNGDSTVHPAFLVNGVQRKKLAFGKFQSIVHNSRTYSLPNEDPAANITLDEIEQYSKNKGNGFHCITYMEWGFLALLAKKNGTMPKGNNNYGKDSSETAIVAIPTFIDTGAGNKTGRVATGTGPVTWSDTGAMDGVWDLNGNVWEWIRGVRLVCGELQVIPYNNAADASVNTGASSNEWRALNASATSYNDLFVVPDGKGTTAGTVKLDWVSGHWQWGTSIADASDTSRYASFAKTTASGLSATAKLYLQAMAFLPEDGASDADYGNDVFWANNAAAERCAFRGGSWYDGASGGVFALGLAAPRSNRWTDIGGRLACDEETEN